MDSRYGGVKGGSPMKLRETGWSTHIDQSKKSCGSNTLVLKKGIPTCTVCGHRITKKNFLYSAAVEMLKDKRKTMNIKGCDFYQRVIG